MLKSTILAITLLMPMPASAQQLCGFRDCADMDLDGFVTASDALAALRLSVGLDSPGYDCGPICVPPGVVVVTVCGDANGSGTVTAGDASLLLGVSAGLVGVDAISCPLGVLF